MKFHILFLSLLYFVFCFLVLTAPQLAEIEAALRTGSPDEVLVDKFRLVITRRELMTLTGTNWLSDMVSFIFMN